MVAADLPDLRRIPPWSARPVDALPAAVGLEGLLAASDRAIVSVSIPWAYPEGFEYMVRIRLREPQAHGISEIGPFFESVGWDSEAGRPRYRRPEEEFRFAIVFADGRTPEERHELGPPSPDDPRPAAGIAAQARGGGGGPQWSDMVTWVWPLPPPGPLTFTCDWPAMGVRAARLEFEAAPILEAAARAAGLTSCPAPARTGPDPPGASIFEARPDRSPPDAGRREPPRELEPGLVLTELLLGRSASAAVALAGLEAYPTGFAFTLLVRSRRSPILHSDERLPGLARPGGRTPADREQVERAKAHRPPQPPFSETRREARFGDFSELFDTFFRRREPDGAPDPLGKASHGRVSGSPPPLVRHPVADATSLLTLGIAFADGRSVTSLHAGNSGVGGTPGLPPIRLSQFGLFFWTRDSGGTYPWWVEPLPPPGPVTFACRWPVEGIDETWVEIDGHLIRAAAQRSTRRRTPDWPPTP